jgi:hypothetical protein
MRRDELSDIGKKNQFRPAIGFCFDDSIETGKGIGVAFRGGQIGPHELGEQLMGSRLPIPSVVGLGEQNKRIAKVFSTFAQSHPNPHFPRRDHKGERATAQLRSRRQF